LYGKIQQIKGGGCLLIKLSRYMDLALAIILIFIGISGLFKRKIKISSKRELAGNVVVALSLFYLIAAAYFIFGARGAPLVEVGILAVVTAVVVVFKKDNNHQS
jgi:phosphatidylserine synthase